MKLKIPVTYPRDSSLLRSHSNATMSTDDSECNNNRRKTTTSPRFPRITDVPDEVLAAVAEFLLPARSRALFALAMTTQRGSSREWKWTTATSRAILGDGANPVHVAVRRDVLMVRRTTSGKVFFQCRCCRHLPLSQRAKLSVVSPQCVDNLYRSFMRFMMIHASSCEHLPAHVCALVKGGGKRGFSKARSGIKEYWASSALEMGLVDGEDGMSIEYRPPLPDRDDVNVAAVAVADLHSSA